uniref:Embryo surrounding factor 1 brassicaceae domain-containing protein n=1 Tax=Leersia perrieri TaxID=77586 RepID=A0A0D9XBV5_9ORYZ
MKRSNILALFIWAMVAVIIAVSVPVAARMEGIHPQGCRCCYFKFRPMIQCAKACCGSDDENCCLVNN